MLIVIEEDSYFLPNLHGNSSLSAETPQAPLGNLWVLVLENKNLRRAILGQLLVSHRGQPEASENIFYSKKNILFSLIFMINALQAHGSGHPRYKDMEGGSRSSWPLFGNLF